jgi:hypothetical protein
MLALAVISVLVREFQIDVGAIAPIAERLFEACSRPLALVQHSTYLSFNVDVKEMTFFRSQSEINFDRPALIVPIAPLWKKISDRLTLPERWSVQQELPLPPSLVSGNTR